MRLSFVRMIETKRETFTASMTTTPNSFLDLTVVKKVNVSNSGLRNDSPSGFWLKLPGSNASQHASHRDETLVAHHRKEARVRLGVRSLIDTPGLSVSEDDL
jgi:hypothetical protein